MSPGRGWTGTPELDSLMNPGLQACSWQPYEPIKHSLLKTVEVQFLYLPQVLMDTVVV